MDWLRHPLVSIHKDLRLHIHHYFFQHCHCNFTCKCWFRRETTYHQKDIFWYVQWLQLWLVRKCWESNCSINDHKRYMPYNRTLDRDDYLLARV